jgi:hypothetical protein
MCLIFSRLVTGFERRQAAIQHELLLAMGAVVRTTNSRRWAVVTSPPAGPPKGALIAVLGTLEIGVAGRHCRGMRALFLCVVLAASSWIAGSLAAGAAGFGVCGSGKRITCVVDGDTFWLGGEKVRIANIDAPERSEPQCPAELELAFRATDLLRATLNSGTVVLERQGKDRYGRTLALVSAGGRDVGGVLVGAGLARVWDGARHPWC